MTKDGQRFLVNATPQKSSGAAPLTVVLNWIEAGLPRALFHANVSTLARNQVYAVTKDGQRFLVAVTPQKSSGVAPLTVVLNWTASLDR